MCSIPGLPTPGSEAPVVITKVELNSTCGLVELWVNMDESRKQSYEQMRSGIQVPERRFNGSEGKPEDLCLVCVGDAWHRARIVSVRGDAHEVFLIDQGRAHSTTSEALAWAKRDSFVLPPEIESCILANVLLIESKWPDKAEKFLLSLPGKKFTGLVEHVLMPDRVILLDIPVVSLDLLSLGATKKIPADEFKCLALKCPLRLKGETPRLLTGPTQEEDLNGRLPKHDGYFYPELLTGTYVNVEVTEVTDELNIFCRLLIFSKAVGLLSEQLQQHYQQSPACEEEQPRGRGDLCAARGTDGRWHRSRLEQNVETDGVSAKVFHVDEGRTESVPIGDIRPLHGHFLRMPVVNYRCSLSGIEKNGRNWTTDERDHLKSLLLHRSVVARFDHHGTPQDVYDVMLFTADSACINARFIESSGLVPLAVPVQDQHILSSFVSSLRDQQDGDVPSKVFENCSGESDEAVGGAKDGSNSDLKTTAAGERLRGATGLVANGQKTREDAAVTVGSRVSVKVSHIESPKNFWCQMTERQDGLRRLTQDLQGHYGSGKLEPLIQSVCVARDPNDNMWHRARIIPNRCPAVEVVLIDYGRTCEVPLQDVHPIDPAFLQLNAQAFKCCLLSPSRATQFSTAEFQRFVDSAAASETDLKCSVKEVRYDKEGLPLHLVDVETPSDSVSNFLAWKLAQSEARAQIPAMVPSSRYNTFTHGIKIGVREKMWVTFSEGVDHFYCQLDRNSGLYEEVMKDVARHLGQKLCWDQPLALGSLCLAKYTNKKWYRAQVAQIDPKLQVHFVDYGDTLPVNECDIRPFPSQASVARSTPVLAIPLGLAGVPANVPQKVNQWFSHIAIGEAFTCSALAIGEKGKVIVELFEGSLNVNQLVKKKISQTKQQSSSQADQQLPDRSERTTRPNKDSSREQDTKWTNQNGACGKPETTSSKTASHVSATQTDHLTLEVIPEDKQNVAAPSMQSFHSEVSQPSPISCPDMSGHVKTWTYRRPNVHQNSVEEAYATCIVGPDFFWCQQTNTEELVRMTELAQVAGRAGQPVSLETLEPGGPCLALFSSDAQWYRAQVVRKTGSSLHVVFVDFGNESEVEMKDVTSVPPNLRDVAPQAFLCSLHGFQESSGSWDEAVYDDFYNLLVDKPLKVTVVCSDSNSEFGVPQYSVKIQCHDVDINSLMQKYWKSGNLTEEPPNEVMAQTSAEGIQSQSEIPDVSEGHESLKFTEPEISRRKTATVYASCIAEPFYFWCQDTNTETLDKVSELTQEAGQTQQDRNVETLVPGSPCLALFPSDNKWHRAQVAERVGDVFQVVFIDYGNESEADVENVRPLPRSLLDIAPQAILCTLNGFSQSGGSWADEAYDDFYSLLVDKSLQLTVHGAGRPSDASVPQYAVEIECDGVNVNAIMKKYWKELDTVASLALSMESVNLNDTETIEEHVAV